MEQEKQAKVDKLLADKQIKAERLLQDKLEKAKKVEADRLEKQARIEQDKMLRQAEKEAKLKEQLDLKAEQEAQRLKNKPSITKFLHSTKETKV